MKSTKFIFGIGESWRNDRNSAILRWIYQFGYTSKSVAAIVLEKKTGALLDSLLSQGLLVRVKTQSGNPEYIYTLSSKGLRVVRCTPGIEHNYKEHRRGNVGHLFVRHNLYVQSLTAQALRNGMISGYVTERMLQALLKGNNKKRPDVMWQDAEGHLFAIEVELTDKKGKKLNESIFRIIEDLTLSHQQYYPRFYIYLSPSDDIIETYRKNMRSAKVRQMLGSALSEFELFDEEARFAWLEERLTLFKVKEVC